MPAHLFGKSCPQGLTIGDKEILALLLHLELLQAQQGLNYAATRTGRPSDDSKTKDKDAA